MTSRFRPRLAATRVALSSSIGQAHQLDYVPLPEAPVGQAEAGSAQYFRF